VRLEPGERGREVVGPGCVETCLGTATAVVVLTDEDVLVLEDDLVPRGRMHLERHVGKEVTLVVAVEVDLEHAADMRLVVRVIVEVHPVDLDGAVVPGRPARLCTRLPGDARDEADRSDQHADETYQRAPLPVVVHHFLHCAEIPSAMGSDALIALTTRPQPSPSMDGAIPR
jgi:hypothetical protein